MLSKETTEMVVRHTWIVLLISKT